jgi:hypothetical protein
VAAIFRHFNYQPANPSVGDLAITLFKSAHAAGLGHSTPSAEALVFFKRWKNNRLNVAVFEKLSAAYAEVLPIRDDLSARDFRHLMDLDTFEDVDRAIISALVRGVAAKTLAHAEVAGWICQRRQSHWYERYKDLYEAVGYASEFQFALSQVNLGCSVWRKASADTLPLGSRSINSTASSSVICSGRPKQASWRSCLSRSRTTM